MDSGISRLNSPLEGGPHAYPEVPQALRFRSRRAFASRGRARARPGEESGRARRGQGRDVRLCRRGQEAQGPQHRAGQHGRPDGRLRRPRERRVGHLRRGRPERAVEVRGHGPQLGAVLPQGRDRLGRRGRRVAQPPRYRLGRHGRGHGPQLRGPRRRRLQVRGRGPDLDEHGPGRNPLHQPHRHRSGRSRHRPRRRPGPPLGPERGTRRLPDDRRRQDLDEGPVRQPGDGRLRPGPRSLELEDPLRRHVGAPPLAVLFPERRPRQRDLPDDRRRGHLDRDLRGPAGRALRTHRPGRGPLEPERRLRPGRGGERRSLPLRGQGPHAGAGPATRRPTTRSTSGRSTTAG